MRNYIYLMFTLFIVSCTQNKEEIETGISATKVCKALPKYFNKTGFNPKQSAFSSSEPRIKGIAIIQFPSGSEQRKVYQDSSWERAGKLGPFIIDDIGNVYVAPVPLINLIDNIPEKQNIIYKIDAITGIMEPFITLPSAKKPTEQNPYGILGFDFDCETGVLFVTSIMGSTRVDEAGTIFSIQTRGEVKILDKINNIDAMGCGVSFFNDKKYLFFGGTRTSDIYSINLNDDDTFKGKPSIITSLANLGPRGDDKAKKIRFDNKGMMVITGLEFNYNLTAPTEKQDGTYNCFFDLNEQKWIIDYEQKSIR